jgi:hypothetical protein
VSVGHSQRQYELLHANSRSQPDERSLPVRPLPTSTLRDRLLGRRDIEFDLEEDRARCLYGLEPSETGGIEPADVRRVKDIFEQPVFFAQGPGAGQVIQGNMLEDCWLLAAFSAISTAPALLERICVAVSSPIWLER